MSPTRATSKLSWQKHCLTLAAAAAPAVPEKGGHAEQKVANVLHIGAALTEEGIIDVGEDLRDVGERLCDSPLSVHRLIADVTHRLADEHRVAEHDLVGSEHAEVLTLSVAGSHQRGVKPIDHRLGARHGLVKSRDFVLEERLR